MSETEKKEAQCPWHIGHLRPELGVLPKRLLHLPLDRRGYPVPWFVDWIDGEPEFRAMSAGKFERAIREGLCWVCGGRLGVNRTFVAGPMCVINRTSAEPPSHHGCAKWSAQNCPFLVRPHMERREDDVINNEGHGDGALLRNPGCTALVTTKNYRVFSSEEASATGWLIDMGEFERVEWFAEGRPATRAEVEHSVETGLPLLREICEREPMPQQIAALAELLRAYTASKAWWPNAYEEKGKVSQ